MVLTVAFVVALTVVLKWSSHWPYNSGANTAGPKLALAVTTTLSLVVALAVILTVVTLTVLITWFYPVA